MKKKTYWRICTILVPVLVVLAYTPLLIPDGVYKPMLLGLPFTLWTSFILTAALVALTYIGARVHPGKDEGEGDS
jgi:hypothetical protein